ncbi:hypothetical protein [Paracoccus sp. SM22M-07]|uniref:hypothetical protein n=1 Tax=Paracoccus sp. SM22M-07 TaxID=1520813 RepID=UPI000912526A|nr:hypothetical protein [Paracoccus sp. SM22M-07]OJH45173.1 hypothetical protein IE00_05785 [Paracoccus sp. SM22M-07]
MAAEYDRNGAFLGYKPTGKPLAIVKGNPDNIETLLRRLEGAFAPAGDDQIDAWLAELGFIAPSRKGSDLDADLQLAAYRRRLQDYPADVVREALLVRAWRFFPSWAELKEVCDELVQHRAAVRDALVAAKDATARASNAIEKQPHEGMTRDKHRRVATELSALFPQFFERREG